MLSDVAEVEYKCTAPYDPADELRLLWNDPAIGDYVASGPPVLLSPKTRPPFALSQCEKVLPVFK